MKVLNEYDQQAQDFARKTNLRWSIKFKKNDYYFQGDKEPRDIYNIMLQIGDKQIRFTFGQSIYNTEKNIVTTLYDILACLSYYYGDYNNYLDFCNGFGYDYDSKDSRKIHQLVLKEQEKLRYLFNDDQLEMLNDIQ